MEGDREGDTEEQEDSSRQERKNGEGKEQEEIVTYLDTAFSLVQ